MGGNRFPFNLCYCIKDSSRGLTVGNVDALGNSGSGKGQDIQGGEVWLQELVLLEGTGPGHDWEKLLRILDELLESDGLEKKETIFFFILSILKFIPFLVLTCHQQLPDRFD